MLPKQTNNGRKTLQRADAAIDRAFPYKQWLYQQKINGTTIDIDSVLFRWKNGVCKPVAIIELTRCDKEKVVLQEYLDKITERYFIHDKQGEMVSCVGSLLHVPIYLLLFQKEMKWLIVYSFRKKEWRRFTPEAWVRFLNAI